MAQNHSPPNQRRYLILGLVVMLLYLCLLPLWQQHISIFGKQTRLLRDDWDRRAYFFRGSWIRRGGRPYLDAPSEYPPLATYFFAIAHLFTKRLPAYMWVHSLLMAGVYLGALFLMLKQR